MKDRRVRVRGSGRALWMLVSLCAVMMIPVQVAAMSQATPAPSETVATPSGTDFPDFAAYPGVKQAVARTYMADFDAIAVDASADQATPGATPELATPGEVAPEFNGLGMLFILGTVIEFDTPANADSAFPGLVKEIQRNTQLGIGSEDSPLTPVALDGVGQESKAFSLTVPADSFGSAGFLVISRRENVIYSTFGMALHGDAHAETVAFATKLVSGTIGSGEPVFKENGTSTGGIWEVYPPKGDTSLGGLVPLADGNLFPESTVKP
ncbi:MAG: hypothetical protein ACR2OE_09435 [Thermomicrobiales bacterium]